jgi:NAD(P)-dependent dehydrogenase (short-subunit alcohol dehydrogenase family)
MTALDGKVILLTGATDGMGRALAADLARAGATVLVHGRDPQRIAATVAEVAEAAGTGDRVRSYQADLASLAEVRGLAGQIAVAEPRLDVLVNNAGIGINEPGGGVRQESADGIELRFAVSPGPHRPGSSTSPQSASSPSTSTTSCSPGTTMACAPTGSPSSRRS